MSRWASSGRGGSNVCQYQSFEEDFECHPLVIKHRPTFDMDLSLADRESQGAQGLFSDLSSDEDSFWTLRQSESPSTRRSDSVRTNSLKADKTLDDDSTADAKKAQNISEEASTSNFAGNIDKDSIAVAGEARNVSEEAATSESVKNIDKKPLKELVKQRGTSADAEPETGCPQIKIDQVFSLITRDDFSSESPRDDEDVGEIFDRRAESNSGNDELSDTERKNKLAAISPLKKLSSLVKNTNSTLKTTKIAQAAAPKNKSGVRFDNPPHKSKSPGFRLAKEAALLEAQNRLLGTYDGRSSDESEDFENRPPTKRASLRRKKETPEVATSDNEAEDIENKKSSRRTSLRVESGAKVKQRLKKSTLKRRADDVRKTDDDKIAKRKKAEEAEERLPDEEKSDGKSVKPKTKYKSKRRSAKWTSRNGEENAVIESPNVAEPQESHNEDIVFNPKIDSSGIGIRTMVTVPCNGKNVTMECLTDYSTMHSNYKPSSGATGDVLLGRGMVTAMGDVSSGSIKISPDSSKGAQIPRQHHLIYCVMTGTVLVTIHRAKKTLDAGGHIFVPCGVSYDIQNVGMREAVLSYFKIKRGCINLDGSD